MGKLGWSCRPCSLLSTFALGTWDQGSDAPALPLEPSRNGDAWVAKGKMCPPFAPPTPSPENLQGHNLEGPQQASKARKFVSASSAACVTVKASRRQH